MSLVEFIEDHGRDTVEQWVVLQHARQDAFGHDLNAGAGRDFALEADAIADRIADRFAELCRHVGRRCTRGDATWFQHQDLARAPLGCEQGQWYACGLARSRRRFEHHARLYGQAREQRGQNGIDGLDLNGHDGGQVGRARFDYRRDGGVSEKTKAPAGALVTS